MSLPLRARVMPDGIDPSEQLDFTVSAASLLQSGEAIDTWTLEPLASAAALGLQLGSGDYEAALVEDDTAVLFWPSISDAQQNNPAWEGGGSKLGLELTFTTTSTPPRTFQQIFYLPVFQKYT